MNEYRFLGLVPMKLGLVVLDMQSELLGVGLFEFLTLCNSRYQTFFLLNNTYLPSYSDENVELLPLGSHSLGP